MTKQKTHEGFGMPTKKHDHEIYLGKLVRISYANSGYLGVVWKITKDSFLLCPSYVPENEFNQDGSTLPRAIIEKQIPTTLPREGVESIQPLSESYLEKLAKSANSVKPKAEQPQSRTPNS